MAQRRLAFDARFAVYISSIAEVLLQLLTDSSTERSRKAFNIVPSTTTLISKTLKYKEHINVHFNTYDIEGNGSHRFQILALGEHANRECTGVIELEADVPTMPNRSSIKHDPDLLTAAQWFGFDASISDVLRDVKIGAAGCEGHFQQPLQAEDANFELHILQAVLSLIPVSTINTIQAGNTDLTSIGSISVLPSLSGNHRERFSVLTQRSGDASSCSGVNICFKTHTLIIRDLILTFDRTETIQPPLRSLFSAPSMLPDVSQNDDLLIESLENLITLVLHKWPMADIGIAGFNDEQSLRSLVNAITRRRRQSYRSITILSPQLSGVKNSKVRFVDDLGILSGLHLLFLGGRLDLDLQALLAPGGIICSLNLLPLSREMVSLSRFRAVDGSGCRVYRRMFLKSLTEIPETSVIFTDTLSASNMGLRTRASIVTLKPISVSQFCERSRSQKYPAIIIDSSERSLITTWTGKDLVPWLQHLMYWASSIIWMTRGPHNNPFHGTASILLRTLQAEQPSLKVTWLVCKENEDDDTVLKLVERAFASLDCGENEIKRDCLEENQKILRYVPDDLLSASVGLAPPLPIESTTTTDLSSAREIVRYRKSASLLDASAIYVIVGGLGGLGRFVCSWMVSHGARKLAVVSRSGTASAEAQGTLKDLQVKGVSVDIFKADASDRDATKAALSGIRGLGPIKGVLNMAMILADVPLATMTGEEWDICLRLKVDSSWILHEETLNDKLDFFFLFSSIASVLGNRNQANYNVGNAFLNALAEHRHTLGLPAVSVALGAMTEIGVLHEAGIDDLLGYLSRTALTPLTPYDLGKILEAAIIESPRRERPIIVTGLEMLERINGKIAGKQDQTQLIWTEWPEVSPPQYFTRRVCHY